MSFRNLTIVSGPGFVLQRWGRVKGHLRLGVYERREESEGIRRSSQELKEKDEIETRTRRSIASEYLMRQE